MARDTLEAAQWKLEFTDIPVLATVNTQQISTPEPQAVLVDIFQLRFWRVEKRKQPTAATKRN